MFRLLDFFALQALIAPLVFCLRLGEGGILLGLAIGLPLSAVSFGGVRAFDSWLGRHPALTGARPGVGWVALSWLLLIALVVWVYGLAVLGLLVVRGFTPHPAA